MELKYRKVLNDSSTISIAAGGTSTLTIDSPNGLRYFVKSLSITKGTNITVDSIEIDGTNIGLTGDFDTETSFGTVINYENIKVNATNAGTAAENLTVVVKGFKG